MKMSIFWRIKMIAVHHFESNFYKLCFYGQCYLVVLSTSFIYLNFLNFFYWGAHAWWYKKKYNIQYVDTHYQKTFHHLGIINPDHYTTLAGLCFVVCKLSKFEKKKFTYNGNASKIGKWENYILHAFKIHYW